MFCSTILYIILRFNTATFFYRNWFNKLSSHTQTLSAYVHGDIQSFFKSKDSLCIDFFLRIPSIIQARVCVGGVKVRQPSGRLQQHSIGPLPIQWWSHARQSWPHCARMPGVPYGGVSAYGFSVPGGSGEPGASIFEMFALNTDINT